MRYLLQAVVALGVLIGLPIFLETPSSIEAILALGGVAVVLVGTAFHGITTYVRTRKPRVFMDSVLPDKAPPDAESTVSPVRKKDG